MALVVIPYSKVNIEGRPLWDHHGARCFRVIVAVLALFLAFLAMFEAWTVLVPTPSQPTFLMTGCA